MLVGAAGSLSCIFTLVHLVKFYCLVEAFIHFTGQGLCTLLVWAARVGMGDLTLAVLKPQLLFISSPPLSSSPLFFSVLISALFFHLPPSLSSSPFFLFQLPSLLYPSPPLALFSFPLLCSSLIHSNFINFLPPGFLFPSK